MIKPGRWFLFFLLGVLWPAVSVLGDEDLSSESSSALSAPSGASEEAMPPAAPIGETALPEAIPEEPVVEETVPADTMPEAAAPELNNTVQDLPQGVRDPFESVLPPEVITEEEPLAGPGGPAAPEVKVDLQGIGFGSKDAYAVFGGDVFFVGDEKKGIKLLEVRRREVDILVNGKKVTVLLFEDQDLKKALDRAKNKGALESASVDEPSETPLSLSGREQPPL
jgi:hypothetical protein